ncbi:MAG: 4-hydroxythreonine-4-phosphate dehydrogenase PdxA [Pseudomonadota bacterium]
MRSDSSSAAPKIIVTAGEPAGIGPELVLALAKENLHAHVACCADPEHLRALNETLGFKVQINTVGSISESQAHRPGCLSVLPTQLLTPVTPGQLDARNSHYVLNSLNVAIDACVKGEADAMVTGPLQKSIINEAGISFSGHTEYLAARTRVNHQPVMLLASDRLRVALATTHLALQDVPKTISAEKLLHVINVTASALKNWFGIAAPRVAVCGLNPHAGESGHFGNEEINEIAPAIAKASAAGVDVVGPLPADTAFTPSNREKFDCFISMFHDQGLPVIKALNFGEIVNVTLGLPIIRTSVDHGTGLDIAGQGKADHASLLAAVNLACKLVANKIL